MQMLFWKFFWLEDKRINAWHDKREKKGERQKERGGVEEIKIGDDMKIEVREEESEIERSEI